MRQRNAVAAAVVVAMTLGAVAFAGSETPPEGPPWKTDLLDAHREAVTAGKPLFLYFTKTY